MARRRRAAAAEEHENHERWLVSYADFITLLFAFFVVMYAISSLNEGKYKVLSQTLVSAFTGQPERPEPIQQGLPFSSTQSLVELPPLPQPRRVEPRKSPIAEKTADPTEQGLRDLRQRVESLLAGPIARGEVNVRQTPLGVVIDIHDAVLFASGQAVLGAQADSVLGTVAQVLREVPNLIQVNGYTDDKPIHTAQFSSNWALSAARAVSVVERFIADGVAPQQLVAAGYGEYHPVASNATAEGRAQNRRVSVVIVSPNAKIAPAAPVASGALVALPAAASELPSQPTGKTP